VLVLVWLSGNGIGHVTKGKPCQVL